MNHMHTAIMSTSHAMGSRAESLFVRACQRRGVHHCCKASREQDRLEHFDFIVSWWGRVEVKAMKARRRGMPPDPNVIYLELKGITGHHGWLYGNADYVAFEQPYQTFLVIPRTELVRQAHAFAPNCARSSRSGVPYTFYSRPNREDLVMVLDVADVAHLPGAFIL